MTKPIIDPGSMLNSSEGLLSASAMAALTAVVADSQDWKITVSACIGISIIAGAYSISRAMVKKEGAA
jgi:hypothetical protein